MKTEQNRTVTGGVTGGGAAVITVWALPQLTDLVIENVEASALTVAFTALFSWLVRYLPRPE